jgi:hypothetical protein
MTTSTSSLPRVSRFRSSLARRPVYASVLFVVMLTGLVLSVCSAIVALSATMKDPSIGENSFTYYAPTGSEILPFYGYIGLGILFAFIGACIINVAKDKKKASSFTGFFEVSVLGLLCAGGFIGPMIGIAHMGFTESHCKEVILESTLGNEYDIIESGPETTYVDTDGAAYKFKTDSKDNAITGTLEKVK